VKKNKFKKKKLERPIYVRNVDKTFNRRLKVKYNIRDAVAGMSQL